MGKSIDITGQKFGNLTVVKKTNQRGADRSIMWECQCDCGNFIISNGSNLRNGHTKSCGCLKKKTSKENGHNRALNLEGKKFGLLTAISPTENRSNGHIIWKCRCDCGNEIFSQSSVLVRGDCCSCGCMKSKGEQIISALLRLNNIYFEKEKTFENLVNSETGCNYRFDFYVNNSYIIEFDGKQHFTPVAYFNGEIYLNKIKHNDNEKNKWCINNNIPIIRIPYTHLDKLCLEDLLLETSNFIWKES